MEYKNLLLVTVFAICCVKTQAYKAHLDARWYPQSKELLQTTIAELSKKAEETYNALLDKHAIKAIIVPHAAYAYSGIVAASVYRLLDKPNIKKVIILVPDHSVSFNGIALPAFDVYQTPLGSVAIDTLVIKKLAKNKLFHKEVKVFDREHSLEVQLPFIQTYLDHDIAIVPFIVGKLTCDQASRVAYLLKPLIDNNTLLIVSTDFTHYGKGFNYNPFKNNIFYNVRNLDSQVVQYIEQGSCDQFSSFIEHTGATICGYYPLKILLSLLEMDAFGDIQPRFISYDMSGQQEKNMENSVSYVGMLFTQQKLDTVPIEQQLTMQEQRGLLQEAKDVLSNLFNATLPQELLYPIQSFGVTRKHGAFATLEKKIKGKKELRGCIGRITTEDPLYKTIATVTQDAALHDTRFIPLQKEELPTVEVKLSILSSVRPLTDYKNIILGKHGVILQFDKKAAVFLPQVALEFKWTLEQMLQELSKKAGLSEDIWKNSKTKFNIFTDLEIGDS